MRNAFRGYSVGERVATGGMSTLYVGVQTALDRKVAIKILHPAFADDPAFISRFEREAKVVASLGHRNIVNIIDFGSENDTYFIVMEFIEGMDLRAVLDRHGPLPLEVILLLVLETAAGLHASHSRGILHRDIKPGNILLSKSGDVKIADFGLARHGSEDHLTALTVPGAVLGTPAYMSPEQAAASRSDHRTDIFSLGVLLYEMVSGARPFTAESPSEIREQIIRFPHRSLRSVDPSLPEPLIQTVDRMLEKEPDRRFQDMEQVMRALEGCADALDPSGALLRRRNELLARFAADPDAFTREMRSARIKHHLDRGHFYRAQGQARVKDAIAEYEAVLRLDPQNAKAAAALEELRPPPDRTLALEKGAPPVADLRPAEPPNETAEQVPKAMRAPARAPAAATTRPAVSPGPPRRRSRRWVTAAGITAGVALAVALYVSGILKPSPKPPVAPSADTTTGTLTIRDAPPGALLTIDGVERGRVREEDFRIAGIAPGSHEVEVSLPRHRPWRTTAEVTAGDSLVLTPKLEAFAATLTVDASPAARVRLGPPGGPLDAIGETPLELQLEARTYRVELASGASTWDTTVSLDDRQVLRLAHAFPRKGTLLVQSRGTWGQVFLDGIEKGSTPLTLEGLDAGSYVVEVRKEGHSPYRETVKIEPGARVRVIAELR